VGETSASSTPADRDLTSISDLIDDPARAAMLAALGGGRALPAGELARRAAVRPGAASTHLRRLTEGGLIRVRVQGRHRYHEIVNPEVATVLEAIAQIAPPAPVRSLKQQRVARGVFEARTCYDHLAGRRGVQLRDRLLAAGAIHTLDDRDHELTDRGQYLLDEPGIDLAALRAGRRMFARVAGGDHQRVPRPWMADPRAGPQPAHRRWLRRQRRKMAGQLTTESSH